MVYSKCFYCHKKTYKYICNCKHFTCLICRHNHTCNAFSLNLTQEEIKDFNYTDSWVLKNIENLQDFLIVHYNFDLSKFPEELKLKSISKMIDIYLNTLKKKQL